MYSERIVTVLCYFLATILPMCSLKIIKSPNTNIWVEEKENATLLCTSDQPWQWCYWERETLTDKTMYQTVQEFTSLKTFDPRVQFHNLDETSCGIQILGAIPEEHQVYHSRLCFAIKETM